MHWSRESHRGFVVGACCWEACRLLRRVKSSQIGLEALQACWAYFDWGWPVGVCDSKLVAVVGLTLGLLLG